MKASFAPLLPHYSLKRVSFLARNVQFHANNIGGEPTGSVSELVASRTSLSVKREDDGRVLLDCKAGCPTRAVVKALDLKMSDLSPGNGGRQKGAPGRIVKTYDYTNAAGQLAYQVCRYEPKTFRQRRPDGKDGWIWNLNHVPRVLYRLPELLAADPADWVFIVEGEKDAETLWPAWA